MASGYLTDVVRATANAAGKSRMRGRSDIDIENKTLVYRNSVFRKNTQFCLYIEADTALAKTSGSLLQTASEQQP
jgi:hypothetical protein